MTRLVGDLNPPTRLLCGTGLHYGDSAFKAQAISPA
jgi:hypothetical protein